MNQIGLDFEQPVLELERKIEELKRFASEEGMDVTGEVSQLEHKAEQLKREIFRNLTPWQRTLLARHPQRPYTLDYVGMVMEEFTELSGDRLFGDDKAIVGGLARLDGRPLVVIGHQKGRDTKDNLKRNFGMAHPEGYRKALRLMKLAEKFNLPVVTFIDTPGAYPGVGAEERGQAEAIALNLREMALLKVPIVSVVIGEGGSGGALGIGVPNRLLMMENAVYFVCTPEACSAILWRDSTKAADAARCLGITVQDLVRLDVVDEVVPEPLGGAHRDAEGAAASVKSALVRNIRVLSKLTAEELVSSRIEKYRHIGKYREDSAGISAEVGTATAEAAAGTGGATGPDVGPEPPVAAEAAAGTGGATGPDAGPEPPVAAEAAAAPGEDGRAEEPSEPGEDDSAPDTPGAQEEPSQPEGIEQESSSSSNDTSTEKGDGVARG